MGNDKPTFASVTSASCTCGYLQEAADDPTNPIVFDEETNEFQFKSCDRQGNCQSMLVIYHCPFCGGAAPESRRHLLFATIPADEEARLVSLLTPIQTINDAISAFGEPDFDNYMVSRYPEDESTPPSTVYQREIRYEALSDVADVCMTERDDGKIYWRLQGKHIERIQGST